MTSAAAVPVKAVEESKKKKNATEEAARIPLPDAQEPSDHLMLTATVKWEDCHKPSLRKEVEEPEKERPRERNLWKPNY